MKKISLAVVSSVLLSTLASPALASKNVAAPAFFDAALCKPPYSTKHAMNMYEAAEKLGKADKSYGPTVAVYHLPAPIKKDGFVAQDVVFIDATIGVLVEGHVAEKLAKKYNLAPEKDNILNMSGFARQLPDAQQGLKDMGLVSLVALNSSVFKNKTLLACQFVSNEDRKNMELLNEN